MRNFLSTFLSKIFFTKFSKKGKASEEHKKSTYSKKIEEEMQVLLNKINQPQTNREYPYALFGTAAGETTYSDFRAMDVGESKSCSYDWAYIEQKIASSQGEKSNFCLMHTHPKPDGEEFEGTLYSKYKQELSEIGVKEQDIEHNIER